MKTIIAVQHAQSLHHTNGMVGSLTDWDLTEKGREQARRIARELLNRFRNEKPVIYSSDLKRAMQTAEAVADAFGTGIIARRELRERDLGSACGKSVRWLRENMTARERTVDDRLFPDAESRREEWERLKPFYDEVMNGNDRLVVIVSHGDLLGAFLAMFTGADAEDLNGFDFSCPAGGVSWLTVNDDGKHVIRSVGDMSYVGELR